MAENFAVSDTRQVPLRNSSEVLSSNVYYSSNNAAQDKFLNEYFKGKTNGVFIDIGAHNGISNSNTYFFERNLGWTGICIEPNPYVFQELKKNRSCICVQGAISSESGTAKFLCHPCTFVSGLVDKYDERHKIKWKIDKYLHKKKGKVVDVRCYVLNELLESNNIEYVDFLSLDTEGGELEILKTIDYEKYYIKVIVVENLYYGESLKAFMRTKGYSFVTALNNDDVFVRD